MRKSDAGGGPPFGRRRSDENWGVSEPEQRKVAAVVRHPALAQAANCVGRMDDHAGAGGPAEPGCGGICRRGAPDGELVELAR